MQALVNELGINIDIYRADETITTLTPVNNIAYTGNHYLSVESINTKDAEEIEECISVTLDGLEGSSSQDIQKSEYLIKEPALAPTTMPNSVESPVIYTNISSNFNSVTQVLNITTVETLLGNSHLGEVLNLDS